MKDVDMQRHRMLMKNVKTPDCVTDAIRIQAEQLRNEELAQTQERRRRRGDCSASNRLHPRSLPQRIATSETAHPRFQMPQKKFVLPVFATVACLCALAIVVAFFSPTFNFFSGGAETETSGNFFTLVAYADENPEKTPGKTVALGLGHFSAASVGTSLNPASRDGEPSDPRWGYVSYGLDLSCTGESIASINYELIGDYASFDGLYNGDRAEGAIVGLPPSSSFSIDYSSQDVDKENMQRFLNLTFPLNEEETAACLARGQKDGFDEELWLDYMSAVNTASTRALEQTTLALTATFADGSTQTKNFRIAPVEDFKNKFREALANNQSVDGLFTLTEI